MSDPYLNKQEVYLDSHNKLSGTHNSFSIEIKLKPDKEVDTVVCKRATIKKSNYIVQEPENTFNLKEGLTIVPITVPEGNYSASSFKTTMIALLNTASPNLWTYSISIPTGISSASTGIYTYTCVGGNPSFIFTTNLYEQMGFEPNSTNTFASNTLIAPNVVNFQVKNMLRIHSNVCQNENDNILQEIVTTGSDFQSLKYQCVDIMAECKPFVNKNNIYKFEILDEDGLHVDLSLNVTITLMFFKKNTIIDDTCKMAQKYMDYQVRYSQ
jgi:hypothetical protein